MIQMQSMLDVADNTGARSVMCIKVLGGSKRRYAQVGDVVVCSVQIADSKGQIKKGQVVKALIVRTKYYIRRKDGTRIKFDGNYCVLLDDKGNPVGTRIFGPIPREIKDRGNLKIASMAVKSFGIIRSPNMPIARPIALAVSSLGKTGKNWCGSGK